MGRVGRARIGRVRTACPCRSLSRGLPRPFAWPGGGGSCTPRAGRASAPEGARPGASPGGVAVGRGGGGVRVEERLARRGRCPRRRRGLETGRGAGAVDLLADLGLAALELLHVFGRRRDLAAPELLPLVGHRLAHPVHVGGDPADRHVGQEQHGGQPEQVRPEVGEPARVDQPGVAAEVVGARRRSGAGRGGRRGTILKKLTTPSVRLASVSSGRRVRPKLAVLVGIRDGDPRRDHPLDAPRAAVPEVDEVVAAGVGRVERRLVFAGRGLDQFDRLALQVGVHDVAADLEEVEELVVLVERVDHDPDAPLVAADGQGQVAGIDGPHRPADDLRPERRVPLPVGPALRPAPAGVRGERDRPAQPVRPVRQDGVDLARRQAARRSAPRPARFPSAWSAPGPVIGGTSARPAR